MIFVLVKSNVITLELLYIVDVFVSIDAGAQVAIILLACGPFVVIVNCWDRFCTLGSSVELPVQRRLCPIFMSGVRLPDIHEYSVG